MGLATYAYNRSTSGGEIITNLINASDGAGLHFNGTDGTIDIASPPDLGTAFSFEFIIQADSFGSANRWIVDFGNGGRFIFGSDSSTSYNLGIYDNASWKSLGVKVLDDLKVHHLTLTVDGTSAILYDNSNQVGTATISSGHNLDSCSDAKISGAYTGGSNEFNGTIYRARFFNRVLSSADVTSVYESASIDFADQWGSQTNKIAAAVDKNWGTNQADTGNDANDRATFNAAYGWTAQLNTDISVASNVYQFSTSGQYHGTYYNAGFVVGKKYRVTIRTGTITGTTYKAYIWSGSAYIAIGTLAASTTNVIEFTNTGTGYLYIYSSNATAGTIQLNASSVINEIVAAGAVADFDLAYANPTQSTIVQNRSGSGDATAAGGVSQISPIEQLNSKALRVGTSAATPADGELLVSGKLGVGGVPESKLQIIDTSLNALTDVGEHANYHQFVQGSSTNDHGSGIGFGGANDVGAAIISKRIDSNYKSNLLFYTKDSTVSAADPELRLTISSAGKVSVGTPSDGFLNVTGSESSKYAAKLINSSSQGWGALVFGGADADDYSLRVVNKDDVDLLVVKGNGSTFVKQPEWPLKNELSNSGFDCWSNSTFENTGSDLIDNGDFASASDWGVSTGAWVIGSGVATFTTGSGTSILSQGSLGTTSGKLYKLTFTVGTATATIAITNASASGTLVAEADYAVGAHTVVYEDVGNNDIAFTSSGGNSYTLDNVSLHEGVPGCVAANALGPDGWTKGSGSDVTRMHSDGATEAVTKKGSFYAVKIVSDGSPYYELYTKNYDEPAWIAKYLGRTVTFGCWVKTDAASQVKVNIFNNGNHLSAANTGTGWEWLEVTHTVDSSVGVRFGFYVTNTKTAYISQPMVSLGSAIGSGNYSRPSGEVIWCEKAFASNKFNANGFSDIAGETLNLEVDTNGKFPKGAKAVSFACEIRDSASATTDSYFYMKANSTSNVAQWVSCWGLANDKFGRTAGTFPCGDEGDFFYKVEASGSATTDIYVNYTGVQLR